MFYLNLEFNFFRMIKKTTVYLNNPSPSVDQVGIIDRIDRITSRSIKDETKLQGLKMALNMVDLTTLEGADTENKVRQLCNKAQHLHDAYPGLPTVAAVCVYPNFVKTAKECLKGSGINVASVATAFPSGQSSMEVKLLDVKIATDAGAEEIDMVISRGKFHEGEYNFVFDEIATIKEACGKSRLKVILETGELGSFDKVRKASDIAIEAGDLVLTKGSLTGVVEAITLSKKTFSKIKQNLFWAFAYNVIAIPVAMAGLLHPVIAELAMALSSITVVTNANLLRRLKLRASKK